MKKILTFIAIVLVSVGAIGGYKYFFSEKELPYDFVAVKIGDIIQEVSTTGAVTPAKKIELQFKTAGKIKSILVKIGDEVKATATLVKLDPADLYIQEQQSNASLELVQAKFEQLLAGESPEQIEIYKTAVKNAEKTVEDKEIALENAQQNLKDIQAKAETDLNHAYEDALLDLNDSELKSYNAFQIINSIQRTYFTINNQESITVKANRDEIENNLFKIKSSLSAAELETATYQVFDTVLFETKQFLGEIAQALTAVREIMEEPAYRDVISSANKLLVDTERININTALTNIINSQQTISSTKITNQTNINTYKAKKDVAQTALNAAQGALQTAKDKLFLAQAEPRATDIALFNAQIKEAEANLSLIQKQISDTILRAPINGVITNIQGEIGEIIKAGTLVVIMMDKSEFQIKADISEADIGKVNPGQLAKIELDAFPEQELLGKVIEIDLVETIIQGVIYYKTTIGFDLTAFDGEKQKIKSGMTTNITIITDSRENALIIPQRAIQEKEGKKIVRVPLTDDNEKYQEIEVETGLRGSDGMIEIISGLNKGDKVITFLKQK